MLQAFLKMVPLLLLFTMMSAFSWAEPLPNATFRAQQTLGGLLSYYWQEDPNAKDIGFFFSCAQIGTEGDTKHCSCYDENPCVPCYRWWDAVALEAIANYGIYTNTKLNASIADVIFAHSPYNKDWNGAEACTYVDDFAWYGIAYLRVYEWLKSPKWLERAVGLYNWTWQYGWDKECGGFWWTSCIGNQFKDSITIVEVLHLASKLAYMFPKEQRYVEGAQKIWDWFFSFDGGYGLMSDKYLVSTGAIPEFCCNNSISNPVTKCRNSGISGTSYNQGLLLSSSAYLYKCTGNKTYLNVGLRALDAIFQNYTTKEGILVDEPRGYQTYQDTCYWFGDPGGDWYSFSGIFMNHLSYFAALLADGTTLSKDSITGIKKLVQLTSDAAWNRSAVWPPFSHTDVCSIGPLMPKTKYPKFHWWWGQNVTTQSIVPPDPRLFFHKNGLRCISIGNNTQLWQGRFNVEDKCKNKCAKNPKCSKYLFLSNQEHTLEASANCWIWSYNHSDHICSKGDSRFNVGVKRPSGLDVTCAGHCNSTEPLQLEHGICYCNAECTTNLDCCLDYANHCTSMEPITCKGMCNKIQAQALHGGGYCWCTEGCFPSITDNNCDGCCCPDYNTLCQKVSMPECLDPRTQGSALNLFLAHVRMTRLS